MADPQPSYAQSVAERRLALMQQQMMQNYTEDQAMARSFKQLERSDFQQQVQPFYAEVKIKKGASSGGPTSIGPWGQMGMTKGMKRVDMGGNYMAGSNRHITKGPNLQSTSATGSVSVLSPAARWTTEGYMQSAPDPQEQQQKILKQKTGAIPGPSTGIFADPTMEMVGHDSNTRTPTTMGMTTPEGLAQQFKKRRKEMAPPQLSAPA